jgi:hypothetical protein
MRKLTKQEKDIKRKEFMTDAEMKMVDDILTRLSQNQGNLNTLYDEWKKIDEAYNTERAEVVGMPNSQVNIMNANIEGQVSSLVEQNLQITTRGEGPSDDKYAEWARIILDWSLRQNHIKRLLDMHERRRLKFGNGIFRLDFDTKVLKKFGLSKITVPALNKVFVDGKIKDPLRYQEADYIGETIRQSKQWFTERYGEDKADAIDYGNITIEDRTVFNEDETTDDEDSATLILYWTRQKGKLRLIELTGDGVLLYDSHKEGKRTDNQKNSKENIKSYYKYVNDLYPYFITVMYPVEGSLYGFGDGKLLLPLWDMINNLYDKIRICARPNLLLFDTASEVDLDGFDENSLEPIPFDGLQSSEPVKVYEWGKINQAWWQLLAAIHTEVQRVTRFSALMMGQGGKSDSATEAAIQQQQGSSATDHKKLMLQETLVDMCKYMLGLAMEFYTEGKAFRISEKTDEYMFIDMRMMANVPAMKPASSSFKKDRTDKGKEWEIMMDGDKPVTKSADFDIDISIGAGLPKNKTFMWQMIQNLSALTLMSEQGQPKPAISWEEFRKFINEYLGIPIKDNKELQNIMMQDPNQMKSMNQTNNPIDFQDASATLARGTSPLQNPLRGGQSGGGAGA